MKYLLAVFVALAALAITGCGGSSSGTPKDDPKQAAVKVLTQIVHNRYTQAWDDLHPTDQAVAPRDEYVTCESRSPVASVPLTVRPVGVKNESIGLGDGIGAIGEGLGEGIGGIGDGIGGMFDGFDGFDF